MSPSAQNTELATVDVHGLILALLERGCRVYVEPRLSFPVWRYGLGDVVSEILKARGVPIDPIPVVNIARAMGILPPVRRVRAGA